MRRFFEEIYYGFEYADTALTAEQEQKDLAAACEKFSSKGYDKDVLEEAYYRYKVFYQLAQTRPKEERLSFFCELSMLGLDGPVAVSLLENEETGNQEAKIIDTFNKED